MSYLSITFSKNKKGINEYIHEPVKVINNNVHEVYVIISYFDKFQLLDSRKEKRENEKIRDVFK